MKLTVLGCSPSYPNPGGHSSSYLLQDGDTHLLIDCGHGAAGVLRAVMDVTDLTGIVLSHMHPDHFFDLIPLRYALQSVDASVRMPLWLPPGGKGVLASLLAPLGLPHDFFSGTYEMAEYIPEEPLDIGTFQFRFVETRHFISAFAMRVVVHGSDGPAFFFSSDTAPSDAVQALARGASLALVEATQLHEESNGHAGHLTGSLAGSLASGAGVRRLLLTHYPSRVGAELLAQASVEYDGPVELAHERETYDI